MSAPRLAGVVPELVAPSKPRRLSTTESVLGSGLRVVAVRKPGVPLVELRLRIPMGTPRAALRARATVLSDTILTGTCELDRAQFAGAVQALGADVSASVDSDRLQISANTLSSNLRPLLVLLRDVLTGATYPSGEVRTERQRLIENLTIARSRAGVVANEALARRMFGSHPYGRDLPEPEQVASVTPASLRKLHAESVRPDGSLLVVVGDISPARVIAAIDTVWQDWTGTAGISSLGAPGAVEPGPVELIDRAGSVQSAIRMGTGALRRDDPGYAALQLANTVFGGYFSSRWTENLREDKGYTYGPHSRIDHRALGSTLTLDVDVATEVTAPAMLETFYELGRIASLPVTEAELESVRQYAIGTLALSTATQAGLASTLVALLGGGLDVDWLIDHPTRLAKVGLDEVSEAARQFFAPTAFTGVIVGDLGQIAEPMAALTAITS